MEYSSDIKVLLAEDDKNLGMILKNYLIAKGYKTKLFPDGQKAWEAFKEEKFDFCLIDVMMPVMDGFTLVEKIRSVNNQIPIIFLTAKSQEADKLKGFSLGSDDYITKPFSMEELTARIQAILRRSTDVEKESDTDQEYYNIGKIEFDYNRRVLLIDEQEHKLTSKEAQLLKMLVQNANKTLDRGVALKAIWRDDSYFNARSMDVYIAKLRKHLKAEPKVELMNVHGVGFKLIIP